MSLKANLRHLEQHPVRLEGEADAEDLEIETKDELVQITTPLQYDLSVERAGATLLVTGGLELELTCRCVRCLREFRRLLELREWSVNVPLEGEEAAPVVNDCVDLTPYAREDILLALPQHPLCEAECSGLPYQRQDEKSSGEPAQGDGSPAWDELNKLKL